MSLCTNEMRAKGNPYPRTCPTCRLGPCTHPDYGAGPIPPEASAAVSIEDQVACAERELKMRERVYPRWVGEGRMSQDKADKEIAAMRAIIATLQALPKTQPSLL
jgi:hypothetical protein